MKIVDAIIVIVFMFFVGMLIGSWMGWYSGAKAIASGQHKATLTEMPDKTTYWKFE